MIRFGLRLTLRGGREAATRLVVITTAVALGVGLLLVTLAGLNAVNSQNARYAWLETGAGARSPAHPGRPGPAGATATDPAWWLLSADMYHGRVIGRVDVAATGPHSPVPPGIPSLPRPGQFYASPALTTLLHSTPAAELGDRYPGTQIGTIGPAALPAPGFLIIIIGQRPSQLAHWPGAALVTAISTTSPSSCSGAASCLAIGLNAKSIDLILSVVAAGLLLPVLIFIGVATRLSAARREQRFAALRLVGATPRQVAVISAVESAAAATLGVAAGFGLFYLLRPALAPIPFTGEPFFVRDLSLTLADIVVVAAGVPLAAAAVARLALRRVTISPLGVTRRATPGAPRAWRLSPPVAGLAELVYFAVAGRPSSTDGQIYAFTSGIVLTMAGLVIAGSWLTMVGSRLMTRQANRPATLIAARRLADNPQAGFRAISGLIVALFAASVAVGVITTMDAYHSGTSTSAADRATLVDQLIDYSSSRPRLSVHAVPAGVLDQLRATPGIEAVTIVHADPDPRNTWGQLRGVVSCAQLARTPALGRCPAGATAVTIVPDLVGSKFAPVVWPAATISPQPLERLKDQTVAVATDGSKAAIERVRTILQVAYPARFAPATIAESQANNSSTKRSAGYRRLADVMVIGGLAVAGCTLAVSLVAGLNDRRRPFSLLRLTGVPVGLLRRVVALESAAPLFLGAAAAMGSGFLAAYLFTRAQLDETLHPPGAEFFVVVLVGLIASLAIIASTLPLLERITGPDRARNE